MFNRYQDQAAGLRKIMGMPKPLVLTVLSVLNSDRSTRLVRDLAISLSRQGSSVWMLHAKPEQQYLAKYYDIKEIPCLIDFATGKIAESQRKLDSTPGLSIGKLLATGKTPSHYGQSEMNAANQQFKKIVSETEIVLVDAQLTEQKTLPLSELSQSEIVIQLDSKADSIKQAYQLIKTLSQQLNRQAFSVLISDASEVQAQRVFQNLAQVAKNHLKVELHSIGLIPEETRQNRAYAPERSVVDVFPTAAISLAFNKLALKLGMMNTRQLSSLSI